MDDYGDVDVVFDIDVDFDVALGDQMDVDIYRDLRRHLCQDRHGN